MTFTMLHDVPADWDGDNVSFHVDGSGWCAANAVHQLAEEEERALDGCCFTCHRATGKYVRDATPEDIANLTAPKPEAAE